MKENLDAAKSIIDSISGSVWAIFFTLVGLYVCWLTAVYLVSPAFYNHAPLIIYLAICLAITIQDYVTNYLLVVLLAINNKDINPDTAMNGWIIDLVIAGISLITLGGAILMWYVVGWQFRYLIIVPNLIKYIPIFIVLKKYWRATSQAK